ncbi:MAG: hypothetical protein MZU84_01010 [Sphingobacterium sp.]|nr:hypothetical protein [Sphingobacterium sp.]
MKGLGFMASMFHLFTHAMFKALLFLGAGAIIHAVHSAIICTTWAASENTCRSLIPHSLLPALTIAGIPPFSGFFSKDEILAAALHHDKILFYDRISLLQDLTAFYMFRLYFMHFLGKRRRIIITHRMKRPR